MFQFLTPPPHASGTQLQEGEGGLRGQIGKIHWGIMSFPKMMILKGFKHPSPYIWAFYANNPQKEGAWRSPWA